MFLVRRFVAGKTAEEALDAVRTLNEEGLRATLDFLGEETRSIAQARASREEYVRLLGLIASAGLDSNVSLKLTQLGLNLDPELAFENLRIVVEAAADRGNFVRIDMEGSAYTQTTLDLFRRVFDGRKNAGVVIQAYLRRSAGDVSELIRIGARVRLCKGAYKEPPRLAFQDPGEVNESYDALARSLLERGDQPGLATHDEGRIESALRFCKERGVGPERFEFQMLYGVRRDLWKELSKRGCGLRIYVPYGAHWFPYYYRRIRERKENLFFALRSVLRG